MADTMREKLVELLCKAKNEFWCRRERCNGTEFVADHLIANGVTIQRWIPVSERLPELDADVLAFNGDYIFVSQYCRRYWGSWDKTGHLVWERDSYAKNPTHWMPLPGPPKEVCSDG